VGLNRWPVYLAIAFVFAILGFAAFLAVAVSPVAPAGLVPLLEAIRRMLPSVFKGSEDEPRDQR